ncbi:MAG: hypothetical protein JXR51_11230 [Bacteroidales bacterium]|nr:hypothetical protein [Bacteroidales bacterium]MBN2757741.1 hypothetical protein [Bacteroidales bacterium]
MVGSSHPNSKPLPNENNEAINFIGYTLFHLIGRIPSNAPSISCTPLPDASGANFLTKKSAILTPAIANKKGHNQLLNPEMPAFLNKVSGKLYIKLSAILKMATTSPTISPINRA